MINVYTLPSHFPSRQAVNWFKAYHINFKEYRVRPKAPELVRLPLKLFLSASENGLDDLLAFKGKSMVAFTEIHDIDEMSLNELLACIAENPLMLHFPIIFDSDRSIIQSGFSEEDIRTFIPHTIRHKALLQLLKPLDPTKSYLHQSSTGENPYNRDHK